jgi:uncharacterized protein (TIGR02246 family)
MSFRHVPGYTGMSDNEKQIRDLIERWVSAVHTGDLPTVLADHSADIVMFDVPPPHDGVRGIDAYRETWPPFFEWQASGAVFELVSLEVTAGDDVAFAHALLRCGTPDDLARQPDQRLRLTLGLRKEDGRWVVSHEHHSFCDTSAPDEQAEREVRDVVTGWSEKTAARDLDGLVASIDDDVVSYELDAPLRYVGIDAVREVCRQGLEAPGEVSFDTPDLTVAAHGDLAVAWGLDRVTVDGAPQWSRGTRVFRRKAGAWTMVHQHLSYPHDPATGRAATDLAP